MYANDSAGNMGKSTLIWFTVDTSGDSSSNPIAISLGETTGSLPGPGGSGERWYSIVLTAGDYFFNLTGPSGSEFILALYNQSGVTFIASAEGPTGSENVTLMGMTAGAYLIEISPNLGSGSYTLNATDITVIAIPEFSSPPVILLSLSLFVTAGVLLLKKRRV